jgi:mannitol/fructose-specific phosphotransferase system IIA component (Ntr-type)
MEGSDVADYVLTELVAEFRNEGFYTSLLSKADNIWEIAMDDMEISVRRDKKRILVQCTPEEEAMVMTAWMEVASKVNDLARSISKPMRRDDLDRLLKDTESAKKKAGRNIARYLQGFVMLPKFKASTKAEAIERIVAEIGRVCPNHVKDIGAATAAVMRREASMPTGLDHGIAVPHGRDPSVVGIAGAVAIVDNSDSAGGCIADYETIDKSPVEIIVLTLANDEAQTPYLQLMAAISRMLRVNDGYIKLAKCASADEMRRFFRSAR